MPAVYPIGRSDIYVGLRSRRHAIGLVFSSMVLDADHFSIAILESVLKA